MATSTASAKRPGLDPRTIKMAFSLDAFLKSRARGVHLISPEVRQRVKFIMLYYSPPSAEIAQSTFVASHTETIKGYGYLEMWSKNKHKLRTGVKLFLRYTWWLPRKPIFVAWRRLPKGFSHLPTELLLLIVDQLSLRDFNALTRVNRHMYTRLHGELYTCSKRKFNDCAMYWALRQNMIPTLGHALAAGSDLLSPSPGHKCALQFAIGTGNADVVRFLASKGGALAEKLNASIKETLVTRIQTVPQYQNQSIRPPSVEALLQMGANPNLRYEERWPLLWIAVRGKYTVAPKDLSTIGIDQRAWAEVWSWQPRASHTSEVLAKNVRTLLAYGADPNAKSLGGISVLYLACAICQPNIVRALLKAGADPNVRDSRNQTPLHAAAWDCEEEDLVDALFAAPGIDLNARDDFGRTPLTFASLSAGSNLTHYFVKKALKTRQIDFNAQDVDGKTPLYHAIERTNLGMVRLLLQRQDLDPNIGRGKAFPLFLAVEKNYLMTVKLLLKKRNINLNRTSHFGMTALLRSALSRNALITAALLSAGADPDLADEWGQTARQAIVEARLKVLPK